MRGMNLPNLVLILLMAASLSAATRLVPDQYDTIQAAIDDCDDGDMVIVAPSTYTGEGNRDIDFKGKTITVKSENGPNTCIIDCQGSREEYHRGFYFHSGEAEDSILSGFTVTGGYVQWSGGGILCAESGPSISDCVIVGNVASLGGGIAASGSEPVVSNCIISGNRTYELAGSGDGGGISCREGFSVFRNCTVYGNIATGNGGGVACGTGHRSTALFVNCIIAGNQANLGEGNQMFAAGHTTAGGCMSLEIVSCCIQDEPNAIFVEEGCSGAHMSYIKADPKFAQPGYWDPNESPDKPPDYPYDDFWIDGDYHLRSQAGRWDPSSQSWVQDSVTSLCIDAGDPNGPIGHEPFPNGGTVNMGAYGGSSQASKSYFGEPVCETIVAGDINGDCKVDLRDFVFIALHWLEDNSP